LNVRLSTPRRAGGAPRPAAGPARPPAQRRPGAANRIKSSRRFKFECFGVKPTIAISARSKPSHKTIAFKVCYREGRAGRPDGDAGAVTATWRPVRQPASSLQSRGWGACQACCWAGRHRAPAGGGVVGSCTRPPPLRLLLVDARAERSFENTPEFNGWTAEERRCEPPPTTRNRLYATRRRKPVPRLIRLK
jgi:hypothetical protein